MSMSLLPHVLRPKLTVKYILSSAALLYFSYCLLVGVPFFSSDLPPYTGPYDVGTVDLEIPLESRQISDAIFKDTGLPAFELETVLFSVFYPAKEGARSSRPHHSWISKPVSVIGEGYARLIHSNNFIVNNIFTFVLWGLAGGRKIPAQVDVPILDLPTSRRDGDSSSHERSDTSSFPVIVFSHGAASSRSDYTQYCGEIASRGYVVASIEHRDGSCPGSVVMRADGSIRNVFYMNTKMVQRKHGLPDIDSPALKEMQLAFRQAEMEEAVKALRSINDGHGARVLKTNPRSEGKSLESWHGRLDFDNLVIGGHSYGATGALGALKGAPTKAMPVKGGIALDPGKSSGPLNADIEVPTLVIHSDSWSSKYSIFYGRPHFQVVKELVQGVLNRGKAAWFMTSVGTSHPSVTDAPLLEPLLLSWTTGATIDVHEGVNQYVKVSVDFLQYLETGKMNGILAESMTHPTYGNDSRGDERKKEMAKEISKYWQIHVSAEDA